MLAIVCPGQGAQSPGMLSPWLDLPHASERLAALSEAAAVDLVAHGTTSNADTIRDTAVAQPLIVATSLLALRSLEDALGRSHPAAPFADVAAGHSVGELAAAAAAGVLTDVAAVGLVTRRAAAMAHAAALTPTGMCAVVGGDPDEVLASIEAAGLSPANVNSPGQVVAAGALEGLEALAGNPPARARVIPLQVAGAFHTSFMEPARAELAPVAASWPAADPATTLLSNADGQSYAAVATSHDQRAGDHGHGRATDVLERIVAQIVAPVRWDLCQETLAALGVTGLIELAPGGVLTGLARRTLPGVETVAVKSPADLDAAVELVTRHLKENAA